MSRHLSPKKQLKGSKRLPELAFSYWKRNKPLNEIKTNKYGDTGAELSSHLDPHDASMKRPIWQWIYISWQKNHSISTFSFPEITQSEHSLVIGRCWDSNQSWTSNTNLMFCHWLKFSTTLTINQSEHNKWVILGNFRVLIGPRMVFTL